MTDEQIKIVFEKLKLKYWPMFPADDRALIELAKSFYLAGFREAIRVAEEIENNEKAKV